MDISDADVDNIVISKLVKTKTNTSYLIGYLDKTIRPLVLVMPKTGVCVKVFQVKATNNKLKYFRKDDEKLLQKYKAISTKIKILKMLS